MSLWKNPGISMHGNDFILLKYSAITIWKVNEHTQMYPSSLNILH